MTMTVSRRELRKLREAAGLSRARLAELAKTTSHYVWVAEMPPFGHLPDDVLARVIAVLVEGTGGPPGAEHKPSREVNWECPRCGEEQTQPRRVLGVMHRCPKTGTTVRFKQKRTDS